jgi:hypothetical protein
MHAHIECSISCDVATTGVNFHYPTYLAIQLNALLSSSLREGKLFRSCYLSVGMHAVFKHPDWKEGKHARILYFVG